jgi:uncharacterized protein YabE (DUF348 family)
MLSISFKKIFLFSFWAAILLFSYKALAFFGEEKRSFNASSAEKTISLNDNGYFFRLATDSATIGDFLEKNNLSLDNNDLIIPDEKTKIFSGINIEIKRAVRIQIEADGKKITAETLSNSIGDALLENGISLGRLDKVVPNKNLRPSAEEKIVVTRINEEEITVSESIDFKITTKKDAKLGWREKKIETPGEKGAKEIKYKVTYKNGKEISRIMLSKEILKEPVTQVETQGTYVKTGKADKGQATWYSYQGGMYAASLTIPKGGYAKVTNTANGKSIIVQINDSGPYGKGRIIDLDKVAFQKIAPLGAGVIGVKVEEVLN